MIKIFMSASYINLNSKIQSSLRFNAFNKDECHLLKHNFIEVGNDFTLRIVRRIGEDTTCKEPLELKINWYRERYGKKAFTLSDIIKGGLCFENQSISRHILKTASRYYTYENSSISSIEFEKLIQHENKKLIKHEDKESMVNIFKGYEKICESYEQYSEL